MADYIKREDVIAKAKEHGFNCALSGVLQIILDDIPAADVRANEYTTDKNGTPSLFECEKCGWEDWDTYTGDVFVYCPGCGRKIKSGADMRGEHDEPR